MQKNHRKVVQSKRRVGSIWKPIRIGLSKILLCIVNAGLPKHAKEK